MKRSFALLFVFILLVINVQAQIIVYAGSNFKGNAELFYVNWVNAGAKDPWNGKIVSIKVPEGNAAMIYKGKNYTGESIIITSNWEATSENGWLGNINSVKLGTTGGGSTASTSKPKSSSSSSSRPSSSSSSRPSSKPSTSSSKPSSTTKRPTAVSGDSEMPTKEREASNYSQVFIAKPVYGEVKRINIFSNVFFRGASETVSTNWSSRQDPQLRNQLSSIEIPDGIALILYKSDNYSGESIKVEGDVSKLPLGWDNKVNSFRITVIGADDSEESED